MKRLGGGKHHIVTPDPQHLFAVGFGGDSQAGMDMLHALRRAGGPGGVKPERHLIARCRHRRRCRVPVRQHIRQTGPAVLRQGGLPAIRPGNDHLPHLRQHVLERVRQSFAHHNGVRAAVHQHVVDRLRRQQSVDRHRDHARSDRAPEDDGEIDRVLQQQHHPPLPGDAEAMEGSGKPGGCIGKLGICQGAPGILERHPLACAIPHMAVYKPIDGVAVFHSVPRVLSVTIPHGRPAVSVFWAVGRALAHASS